MKSTGHNAFVFALLIVGAPAQALGAGNPQNGAKVFKKCAACHTLEPGKKKIGPSLYGVIGRKAGTAEDFNYSKAMKAYGQSGTVWGEDTLNVYLKAPRKVVKGTKMAFPGLRMPQDRADVIAYLKQYSR